MGKECDEIEADKLNKLKQLCMQDKNIGRRVKKLMQNTDMEGKDIKDLTYKEMRMIFKYAKTNYEFFMRNDATIYSILCNTYKERMTDGDIYTRFKEIIETN